MDTALIAIHVLAAAVWVGGTVALVFVGVPVIRKLESEVRAMALAELGRRWRPIGWGAIAVLLATGAANAVRRHAFGGAGRGFDVVFAIKIGLVVGLIVASYFHDYVLGPGLARQIRAGEPQTLRRRLILVGWSSFVLTIAIPILGVVLAELAPD